jgi:sugar phosphate isomerase/epimerase
MTLWPPGVMPPLAPETRTPGTWGDEVTVGTGEVDWPAFFAALGPDFTGTLALEREAGEKRLDDLKTGREFVLDVMGRS